MTDGDECGPVGGPALRAPPTMPPRPSNPHPRTGWLLCVGLCVGLGMGLALPGCSEPGRGPVDPALQVLLERHDGDGDGRILREEYQGSALGFERLDHDGNGLVDARDLEGARRARASRRRAEGAPREQRATGPRPLMGLAAPDLELARLGGGPPERLSALWAERPVVLIFGSWT